METVEIKKETKIPVEIKKETVEIKKETKIPVEIKKETKSPVKIKMETVEIKKETKIPVEIKKETVEIKKETKIPVEIKKDTVTVSCKELEILKKKVQDLKKYKKDSRNYIRDLEQDFSRIQLENVYLGKHFQEFSDKNVIYHGFETVLCTDIDDIIDSLTDTVDQFVESCNSFYIGASSNPDQRFSVHKKNGYKKMHVFYKTSCVQDAEYVENHFIDTSFNMGKCRNKKLISSGLVGGKNVYYVYILTC
jgi:endo-beta-N-acetylglucosaminidase D